MVSVLIGTRGDLGIIKMNTAKDSFIVPNKEKDHNKEINKIIKPLYEEINFEKNKIEKKEYESINPNPANSIVNDKHKEPEFVTEEKPEQVHPFYRLVRQNENALAHLSNIRLKLIEYEMKPWKAKVGKITKEYDSCVKAIIAMREACIHIVEPTWAPSDPISDFGCRCKCCRGSLDALLCEFDKNIKEAEEKGVLSVLKLEGIIDGIRPKIEEEIILNELYETVEKLNAPKEVDENIEADIDAPNISTLHDCIRYLHQKGLNLMFNSDAPAGIPVYTKKIVKPVGEMVRGLCYIELVDIAPEKQGYLERLFAEEPENSDKDPDILKKIASKPFAGDSREKEKEIQNLPVRAILEGYQELNQKRYYSQNVKILASEDTALCQIRLGLHFAKLESKIDDDDESFISLNYMDSDCATSSERLAYIKLVMDKLGYTVEINGQNIKANLCNKSKEQTYGALKETIRLLTSTKDLDVCSNMKKREYEAAYRFLKGEVDISIEIDRLCRMDQEECKEFVLNYNYDWGNVEI